MISGIYSITSKINNKIYYGSSNNIIDRWNNHKSELRHNIHHNSHLQRAWNKYGKNNFIFKIEESVPIEKLKIIEQKYLNLCKLSPSKFYNVGYDSECPRRGKPHTEKTKRKIREKRKLQIITDKHKINIGLGIRDKTIYTFKNIVTNEFFVGIRYDFVNKYNLTESQICNVIKGKRKHHKNWTLHKIGYIYDSIT